MRLICDQYDLLQNNNSSFEAINYSCAWTNILLTCPTTVLNLSLIVALASSRERNKPCTILLLNLAITDMLAGLVNMPLYYLVFRYIAENRDPCFYAKIVVPFSLAVSSASFLTVTLIAIERYVKIFYPFYHVTKLTLRFVTVCVAMLWTVAVLTVTPFFAGVSSVKVNVFVALEAMIGIVLNLYCYFRILLHARKVRLQIRNEAARFGQANRSSTGMRYVLVGALIVLSTVICYAPIAQGKILRFFDPGNGKTRVIICWEFTLAMMNSIINPIITCSFCPSIRKSVAEILTLRVSCKKAQLD